jgi:hypothetical protein
VRLGATPVVGLERTLAHLGNSSASTEDGQGRATQGNCTGRSSGTRQQPDAARPVHDTWGREAGSNRTSSNPEDLWTTGLIVLARGC